MGGEFGAWLLVAALFLIPMGLHAMKEKMRLEKENKELKLLLTYSFERERMWREGKITPESAGTSPSRANSL